MIFHSIKDVNNHVFEKELNGIAIEKVNWFNCFLKSYKQHLKFFRGYE